MTAPALRVEGLCIDTVADGRRVVDGLSFELGRGEILGLVGESGSGKTVACRALMRLLPARALRIAAGTVTLGQRDVTALPERALREIRGAEIGMVFQNPSSHLDPVMRIGEQIAESVRLREGASRSSARARAVEALREVGIPDPESRARGYPHEFSGGMRQRAMIAVALACRPKVLIADEPTTALDVTVQAQVLDLLKRLRDEFGVSIVLVTHDLGVVAQTCDSVAVMYAGRLCERASVRRLLGSPAHRYTAGLVRCQPAARGEGPFDTIGGQPPALGAMPDGCRFHPRCEFADALCRSVRPALTERVPGQLAACHHPVEPRWPSRDGTSG